MQSDLPAIASGRKQLDRLILELDTAKARLKTAREVPYSAKILKSLIPFLIFVSFSSLTLSFRRSNMVALMAVLEEVELSDLQRSLMIWKGGWNRQGHNFTLVFLSPHFSSFISLRSLNVDQASLRLFIRQGTLWPLTWCLLSPRTLTWLVSLQSKLYLPLKSGLYPFLCAWQQCSQYHLMAGTFSTKGSITLAWWIR